MSGRSSPQRHVDSSVPAYPLHEAASVQLQIDEDTRLLLPSARELFEQQGAPLPEEPFVSEDEALDEQHEQGAHDAELPQWEGPPLQDIPGTTDAKPTGRAKRAKKKCGFFIATTLNHPTHLGACVHMCSFAHGGSSAVRLDSNYSYTTRIDIKLLLVLLSGSVQLRRRYQPL